ncbi:MAG TPA: hypothetical protein VFF06_00435 [Polyangia bacterium]|nr:hypothetical protein [Polyangia bacterium]
MAREVIDGGELDRVVERAAVALGAQLFGGEAVVIGDAEIAEERHGAGHQRKSSALTSAVYFLL